MLFTTLSISRCVFYIRRARQSSCVLSRRRTARLLKCKFLPALAGSYPRECPETKSPAGVTNGSLQPRKFPNGSPQPRKVPNGSLQRRPRRLLFGKRKQNLFHVLFFFFKLSFLCVCWWIVHVVVVFWLLIVFNIAIKSFKKHFVDDGPANADNSSDEAYDQVDSLLKGRRYSRQNVSFFFNSWVFKSPLSLPISPFLFLLFLLFVLCCDFFCCGGGAFFFSRIEKILKFVSPWEGRTDGRKEWRMEGIRKEGRKEGRKGRS